MFRINLKQLDECIETMKTAQSYQNIIQQNGFGSKPFIMDTVVIDFIIISYNQ